jgi:SAM-dependent methyltransferase
MAKTSWVGNANGTDRKSTPLLDTIDPWGIQMSDSESGPPDLLGFSKKSVKEKLFILYRLARQLSPDDLPKARKLFSEAVYPLARSEGYPRDYENFVTIGYKWHVNVPEPQIKSAGEYFDRLAAGPQPADYAILSAPLVYPYPSKGSLPADDYSAKARAKFIDRPTQECDSAETYSLIHHVLTNQMGSLRGRRILDFGCNIASWIRYISQPETGAEGIGIDTSQKYVDFARRNGVNVMVADTTSADFPKKFSRQFDDRKASAVTMRHALGAGIGTFGTNEDQARQCLLNAHDMLDKDGYCVIEPAIMYPFSIDQFIHTLGIPARDQLEELGFHIRRYGLFRPDVSDKSKLYGQLMILLQKKGAP